MTRRDLQEKTAADNKDQAPKNSLELVQSNPRVLAKLQDQTVVSLLKKGGAEEAVALLPYLSRQQSTALYDDVLWSPDQKNGVDNLNFDEAVCWLKAWIEAGDTYIARMIPQQGQTFFTAIISLFASVGHLSEAAYSLIDVESGHRNLGDVVASLDLVFDDYVLVPRAIDNEIWELFHHMLNVIWEEHPEFLIATLSGSLRNAEARSRKVATLTEELQGDAAVEREDRRSKQGFLTTERAREAWINILKGTDTLTIQKLLYVDDASVRAARAHQEKLMSKKKPTKKTPKTDEGTNISDTDLQSLAWRIEASVFQETMNTRPTQLLGGGQESAEQFLVDEYLKKFSTNYPASANRLQRELAALSNMLVLGVPVLGRNLAPDEALRGILLVVWLGISNLSDPDKELVQNGLISVFVAGITNLRNKVSFKAATLLDTALQSRSADNEDLRKAWFAYTVKSGLKPKGFATLLQEFRFGEIQKLLRHLEPHLDPHFAFSMKCYLQELPVAPDQNQPSKLFHNQKWRFFRSERDLEHCVMTMRIR